MKPLWRAIEALAWSAFFAFAALVLALRFWLLPDIERYRGEIVAAIERTVGLPVKIAGIEAGWLGLRPQINLSEVRVYDHQGREVLALPAIRNVVSWRSLLHGELRLHSLAIDGPRLDVRRDASGALFVAGMKLADDGERRFTDWLLAQKEIVISNAEIEWRDEKRAAPPLALSALNLRLRNSGDEHSIGLTARPPEALGSTFELRAELGGRSASVLAAWNGRLYAQLGYTDLAAWRPWIDYPLDVREGQGALRVWATLENGRVQEGTADVALAHVVVRLASDLAPIELASVQGRLRGRTRRDGYEFSGRGVMLAAEHGPAISATDFQLSLKPGATSADASGMAAASSLELEPLSQLAAALPLPAELRGLLAELAPRGRLLDAKLEWSGELPAPKRIAARGRFADLGMRAHGAMPGFAGLSGSIEATEAKGSVVLAARKAELDLPRVFPEPRIPLDMLNGRIEWERHGERQFAVRAPSLSFSNADLSGNAFGSYAYTGSGPGTIDLSAQLNRVDGAQTARYLPLPEIMGKATRDWLAGAIISGQASDVRLRLRGDLHDFPFIDPAKGQFLVSARVEKGVLNYANGWPRIYDIGAELLFERDKMEIVGRSGTLLGAQLTNVRVSIPSMLAHAPLVLITGQADGATNDFLRYIDATPVKRMIGGFTDPMSAVGRGKLRLKLELPITHLAATRVAGEYEFANNNLTVHPQLPPIERATGKLMFTESTLTVHDVRGRLFGGPLAVSGGSRPGGDGIEVVARGEATPAGVRSVFDHPWRRFLSGAASYSATLLVREGRTRITIESPLRGIASALPAPLAKAAADTLPLRVEVIPAEGGARDRISVALGSLAAAEFARRRQGEAMVVQQAGIWLTPSGEQPVRFPEQPGTLIYGSLAALNVDRWIAVATNDVAGADAIDLDVKIGALDVYGKRINEVSMRGGVDAAGWSVMLTARELAGNLSYRSGQLIARLTHLRVPEDYPGAKPQEISQPKDLPAVDVIAERFIYHDKELGRIEVVAQPAGEDWRLEKLAWVNPEASLTGKGIWRPGSPSRTSVDIELDAADSGSFLARLGYPNLVKGGKARLQGALAWNGDPLAIDYPSLSGHVQMQAQDGQFLEIDPGLGKLVSLMSLQALPRRLTLDFRDVFSQGFQFDRIAADAQIDRGLMAIKEFRMRGSAAQVEMGGEVDLANETQNLHVRVVPSLGDSASTVLAFLNPLLVFPAALAQRILKDPLGHIFAFDYSITGTWADPKVAKLGINATRTNDDVVPDSR
ncbi:MAG TPA: YhdP family protein [Burkholderiales bacterium]|nr:YhdP family protein [Burkholderiales bacterium]